MPGTFTHANMRTGPCVVYVDGTCVGVTIGEVQVAFEPSVRERKTARHGENAVDIIHQGDKITVKANLAEQSIANLAVLLPEGVTVSGSRYFGRVPGGTMSTHAVKLMLRPVDKDVAGSSAEDIVLWKAVVTTCDPITFTTENDRVFGVTWQAMVDDARTDGKKFGYINGITV